MCMPTILISRLARTTLTKAKLTASQLPTDASISVVRDGVRQRFHAVLGARRLHLQFDDGFAAEQPIQLTRALDRLSFAIENRAQTNTPSC